MAKFEHKVPTLQPGPVKKEIVQCLQGIALDEQNIRFHDYTDGIVMGCSLVEEGMKVGLVGGIVKYAGRLYKLIEKVFVPYAHTDEWAILKLRFSPLIPHVEYIHYTAELVLDANVDIMPNEMELGRFKLKKGSRLRTEYKDFWDMCTEFDTVNLLYVNQSAWHQPTFSPAITTHFAREAFSHLGDNCLDAAFCSVCLSSGEAIGRELITQYVCNRLGRPYTEMDNARLHSELGKILDLITGRAHDDSGKGHQHEVLVIN